jgi:hypothetical protein
MSKSRVFRSKVLASFLTGALVLLTVPSRPFAQNGPKGMGALVGHIFDEDMKTPVRNAVVKLRSISTQKEYESEPTDLEGMYRIPGIEEGRYIMGVQAVDGNYNFHYSLFIKANELGKLSVAIKPGGAPVRIEEGRATNDKKSIGDFFKSPAGILSLIVVAEMTLYAIALSEGEASPVIR